jgi:hypothetical protein
MNASRSPSRRPAFSYPPLEGAGWGDSLSPSEVFQRFDFRLPRTMQFDIDSFRHSCQIRSDLRIPKANDAISFLLQPVLSLAITLGCLILIVVSAVELNDQMLGGAEEVDDVRTDRRLPSEMRGEGEVKLKRRTSASDGLNPALALVLESEVARRHTRVGGDLRGRSVQDELTELHHIGAVGDF